MDDLLTPSQKCTVVKLFRVSERILRSMKKRREGKERRERNIE